MMWFWFGLAVGVLLTVPLVALATRRTVRRVRRLAQRAQAAERLAELGTLTGGLAHEIKNPLSSVGLNIQLIQEDLRRLGSGESGGNDRPTAPPPPLNPNSPSPPLVAAEQAELLGRIQRRMDSLARETRRLRDILEDFLRFAGRVKLDLAPTDVGQMVQELTDFFAPQAQEAKVRLRVQLPEKPAVVRADAALLKQALLNLMLNAAQAIVEARQDGPGRAGVNPGAPANSALAQPEELILRVDQVRWGGQEEIHLHVIDTGPGIPADRLSRIFQPYYTTKKGGTGLGLPTTRRIVEEHGGTITVHSEPGRGSDFLIALPVNRPPAS